MVHLLGIRSSNLHDSATILDANAEVDVRAILDAERVERSVGALHGRSGFAVQEADLEGGNAVRIGCQVPRRIGVAGVVGESEEGDADDLESTVIRIVVGRIVSGRSVVQLGRLREHERLVFQCGRNDKERPWTSLSAFCGKRTPRAPR